MLFSSLTFVFIFLPCVLLLYFTICAKSIKAKNVLLLLASIAFYAWGELKFVVVMLASIIVNYIFGILISKRNVTEGGSAKPLLFLSIACNLGILFVFKYLNFFISNVDRIFGDIIPQTNILLPIGISFFTFQAMSYVIDVYRKKAQAQTNLINLALYISLFPQLIAGPIVKYGDIARQITERRTTLEGFGEGCRRFIIGFNKKILIANNLAIVVDWSTQALQEETISVIGAWLGAISYALQIYFDFGGYSDMAIGLGKMFGFEFKENFIYPYSKASIKGFWTENHISMSTWFRDYVYFPLGGSRGTTLQTIRNMFIVWAVTGFWHGASWTFLAWGLAYFVLLTMEKYAGIPEKIKPIWGRELYRIFALISLILLNGVLFRNMGVDLTLNYVTAMLGVSECSVINTETIRYFSEYAVFIIFALIYATSAFRKAKQYLLAKKNEKLSFALALSTVTIYPVLFLISVSYLVMGSHNPFIYFNF